MVKSLKAKGDRGAFGLTEFAAGLVERTTEFESASLEGQSSVFTCETISASPRTLVVVKPGLVTGFGGTLEKKSKSPPCLSKLPRDKDGAPYL